MNTRYVDGVTKIRTLADSLLSCSLILPPPAAPTPSHVVSKEESSADLTTDGEFHDKIDHWTRE